MIALNEVELTAPVLIESKKRKGSDLDNQQRKAPPQKKKPAVKKEVTSVAVLGDTKTEPSSSSSNDTSVTVASATHKDVNKSLSELKQEKDEADPEPQATRSVSIDVLKASSAKKQISEQKQAQPTQKLATSAIKQDSSAQKETTSTETKATSTFVGMDGTTSTTNNTTLDDAASAEDAQSKPRKRTVAVSPPPLNKIESVFPSRILWAKLCIRDFLLRFDSYAKIPSRFNAALDDIGSEWDDRMYKSIVTVCMKFLTHDKSDPPAADLLSVDHYFSEIERTVGNIEKVIQLVDEFLLKNHFIEDSILFQPIDVEAEDGFDQEYRFLHVINMLIGVASQTSIIRDGLNDEPELLRAHTATVNQEIEKAEDSFNKVLAKIRASRKEVSKSPPMYAQPKTSEPRKTKKEQYQELMAKEVAARAARNRKIAKSKEVFYFHSCKMALRTRPLGTDHFGNTYWKFLPRAVDVTEWNWWIVIEKNSAMPNSLQQPVKRNGASLPDDDEQQQQQQQQPAVSAAGQSVKSRHKLTVNEPGTGELYYFEVTGENLKKCLDWLEYQERLYATYKNGGRKHKHLSSGIDTETLIARVIRNLRLLQMSVATFRQ